MLTQNYNTPLRKTDGIKPYSWTKALDSFNEAQLGPWMSSYNKKLANGGW
jgi:hypothetical protein